MVSNLRNRGVKPPGILIKARGSRRIAGSPLLFITWFMQLCFYKLIFLTGWRITVFSVGIGRSRPYSISLSFSSAAKIRLPFRWWTVWKEPITHIPTCFYTRGIAFLTTILSHGCPRRHTPFPVFTSRHPAKRCSRPLYSVLFAFFVLSAYGAGRRQLVRYWTAAGRRQRQRLDVAHVSLIIVVSAAAEIDY